jgi:putative transposase
MNCACDGCDGVTLTLRRRACAYDPEEQSIEGKVSVIWALLFDLTSTIVNLLQIGHMTAGEKDLEILILRKQLAMLERRLKQPPRLTRVEKLSLMVILLRLRASSRRTLRQLGESIRIVQPETILRWHRELVRWKWRRGARRRAGRPRTADALERLVVQLAEENNAWGYGKIQGELLKLGYRLSQATIAQILARRGIPPRDGRGQSAGWRHLMRHYKQQLLACDFFTVETLFLKTLYVFFFIELGTRRVHFAGCTTNPDEMWVNQQARQIVWQLGERETPIRFLLRDRDSKFTPTFDSIFASEGIHVIQTPYRAPNANAYAERWVRSAREECLNKLLIINEAHLRSVMREYVAYHNTARPHQWLAQLTPIPRPPVTATGMVRRREILGGIIGDYFKDTA